MYFREKKNVENLKSVGTGAHKVEKKDLFLLNIDPHFPNIQRSRKSI